MRAEVIMRIRKMVFMYPIRFFDFSHWQNAYRRESWPNKNLAICALL